ncbi:MAG TPA: transcription-repair coupling factor, partial [Acidimicrobiales bacterium]|nr:transcription-repair coupling factor [Acidimicrobiales bacterium]
MPLSSIAAALARESAIEELVAGRSAAVAISEAAQGCSMEALCQASKSRPILVGVPGATDAERIAASIRAFSGSEQVAVFPAWETLPFERVSPSVETMGRRLEIMWGLVSGDGPKIIVASVRALTQRVVPPGPETRPVQLSLGSDHGNCDPEQLVARLVEMGYRREFQVEHRGEVARRGSIVDVFPSTGPHAFRADFFGDEIDRLTIMDVNDQRSLHPAHSVVIHACRELLPSEGIKKKAAALIGEAGWGKERWERFAQGMVFDGMESWLPWLMDDEHLLADMLPPKGQIVLIDNPQMRSRSTDLVDEENALAAALSGTWGIPGRQKVDVADSPNNVSLSDRVTAANEEMPHLHLGFDRLASRCQARVSFVSSIPIGPSAVTLETRGWADLVSGDTHALAVRLDQLAKEGYSVVLCAQGSGSASRMFDGLRSEGILPVLIQDADAASNEIRRPGVWVVVESLEAGFIVPSAKIAVLSEFDITGRHRSHRHASVRKKRKAESPGSGLGGEGFFTDLSTGDYVVHRQHGVGRYSGMVRRALGGAERDYLLVEYKGNDKLYVPSDQLDLLTRYGGGETPALHKLGGSDFQRTQAKVRREVQEIAQELVVLYSTRMATPGFAFSPDSPWQTEMENAFGFDETIDQLRAIADVKADMESPHPMDRIICGDVGFGKTEVAVRAAFKAVQDGKQVAVLVPTTLLAQQHYETFSDRMAGYPIRVEVLSRFLTVAQAAKVAEGLADGTVDVVIGTHRLLSADVKIKDLGLLVVDEEQRFGVSHKEAIKAISAGIDVLTLTASPIPRTLEMGLTGIRDITMLQTPPVDRQPILTFVGEYDELAVVESIRRELLREGQVFFVHNRVRDIQQCAHRLNELVPEARIAVAHGQMDEGTLEKIVVDFSDGRFDVLCCTTIIESGIDMPTVNTLVVERSDMLGLGQLHQLRGRVGRAGQRAYAYLFFPPDKSLTEEAYERLRTIGEHTELGSGLKIAMRDLEIRGAGNLLGRNQSGHIAAVGYDLYVAMVGEALSELKGEVPRSIAEVKLELG